VFNPPRTADGSVIPHDEPLLNDSNNLIRKINIRSHIVTDENTGGRRISSAAFSATSDDPHFGMSVDLGQSVIASGKQEADVVPVGFGAVRLKTGNVRELGLQVGSDPETETTPPNPHHGQIWGVKNKYRKKLHSIVDDWVVPISGVNLR
jgi:hypothetical protein